MVGCKAATARQRGASALILVGAEPSYDETEEREERSQPACQVMICAQPQSGPAWPPPPPPPPPPPASHQDTKQRNARHVRAGPAVTTTETTRENQASSIFTFGKLEIGKYSL